MKYYIMNEDYPLRFGQSFDLNELKQSINKITGIPVYKIRKWNKCTDTGALETLIIKMDYEDFVDIIENKKVSKFFNCFCTYPSTGLRIDNKLLSFLN